MHKQRNRHTPGALTGNTPVGRLLHHALHALLPPARHPANIRNGIQRLLPQAIPIHRHKPLRRGAINQRGFGPPTMRILMLKFHFRQ